MKTFTALSAAALLAFAVPAVAQTTTQPNGTAGATSGTDTKGGSATSGMTEGRSSVNDPKMKAGGKDNAMKNGGDGHDRNEQQQHGARRRSRRCRRQLEVTFSQATRRWFGGEAADQSEVPESIIETDPPQVNTISDSDISLD